jgi:hypothetical protein
MTLSLVVFPQAADNPINANNTFNGEQSLAIDPTNAAHLVVAWMKYHLFPAPANMVIAVSSSTDGGLTWSNPPTEITHFKNSWRSADPTLAFKNDGTLFLGYIDYNGNEDSAIVFVRKSTDGGINWGAASAVVNYTSNADLAIDRPWMTVDNSAGTYSGTVYMVTKSLKTDPVPHHMYMMRSTDAGVTWSTPLLVDNAIPCGPTIKSMGVPAITPSGKLVIAYAVYNPPALPGFAVATSTDRGTSLSNSMIATYSAAPVTNDTLLQLTYKLSSHPTNNNLVLVYNYKSNTDFEVGSVYSTDNGVTWSSPQRICHDAAGNGNNQDMVWADFSTTGKFAAVWRDRRANNGAQNQPYKIWGNFSLDGGTTFSAGDFQLSQTDGPLMIPVDGNDFLGCTVSDSIVYATWTDKRNNSTNQLFINKYKFPTVTGLNAASASHATDIIFPNPNSGAFTLSFENSGEKKIEIFDQNGKLIYHSKTSLSLVDVKLNVAKGYYNVKISEGKNGRNLKLVID